MAKTDLEKMQAALKEVMDEKSGPYGTQFELKVMRLLKLIVQAIEGLSTEVGN